MRAMSGNTSLPRGLEHDYIVHTVEELRAQEFGQGFQRLFPGEELGGFIEARGRACNIRAGVGGHDDDGVFKADRAAVRVGNPALVQNLEQDVHHVRMGLFDFIEQDDGIRLAADFSP